jgi:hypothetical protein
MAKYTKNGKPPYALVVGFVLATVVVGAALIERGRKSRARGEPQKPKRLPVLVLDITTEDLRQPGYLADLEVGNAMNVHAVANPAAGIFWSAAVIDVGAAGSPVAIKQTTTAEQGSQTFQITAVRIGEATVTLNATDPENRVVDSVQLQIDVR